MLAALRRSVQQLSGEARLWVLTPRPGMASLFKWWVKFKVVDRKKEKNVGYGCVLVVGLYGVCIVTPL